jgi:uncharacterized protein (TIGR02594 family)
LADFDLSMAITADGEEAAQEIDNVTAAQDRLAKGQKDLEAQSKRTGQSAADLAKQQKATADAINAVVRATNPAVGSQRLLEAALRKAERAYADQKISALALARAQQIANAATFASATNMRQTQQGARQLGLQFNDLGTQIAAGISPMTAFIQQTGQIGYAMSQMGGTAGKVGNFLAGGWGALILLGASFLGSFIGKLVGADDATKKLKDTLDISKMTLEQLTDAIDKNVDALEKQIRTGQEAEQVSLDQAEAHRKRAAELRKETVDLINHALAEERDADARRRNAVGPGETTMAQGQQSLAQQNVAALEAQLRIAQQDLVKADREIALAQVPLARRRAQEATDPSAKIRGDYDRAVAAATKEFLDHGRDLAKLNAAMVEADNAQREANKKLQDSNRKPRTVSLGDQQSGIIGANILAAAAGHIGQKESSPSLQQFLSGQHIDPEKSAWCAAFINAVLSSQGITGTGSNAARSFLNFGTATNTPQKGDIVVLRSPGAPSGAHVGLFDSSQGGRVNVLGGNQGGAGTGVGQVKRSSFALSDVLAFRRAPTAADQFKDEESVAKKALADAQKLADFGKQAAEQIANLAARAVPQTEVQQAKEKIAQVDALLAEIEKRKPPNMAQLVKDAQAAKDAIQAGINQPLKDYLRNQQQALQVDNLRNAGLTAEADTLQEVNRQEAIMGRELLPEEVKQIYEVNAARKEGAEIAKDAQEKQRKYLADLNQYKDLFRSLFSGNPQDIKDFPKKLFSTIQQQGADRLFDKVFGGIFKQLEDDKTGANKVKASNTKLAHTADAAAQSILKMAQAADTAAGGLGGEPPTPGSSSDPATAVADGIESSPLGDIVKKLGKGINISGDSVSGIGDIFKKAFSSGVGQLGFSIVQTMFGGVGQQGGKVAGGKISDFLGGIGQSVAQFVPQLQAAMAITSGISAAVGLPNFAGGAFGIGGNLIAKLLGFGKRIVPKGGVSISDAFGTPVQGGQSSLSGQFVGPGQNIQDSLVNIAQQLGGALGAFSVAIGTFDGDIRVNTNGQTSGNSLNRRTPGTHDFNDDMQAAVNFAIMDAIKDGAITGLSAAVQKAIQSSPDIDRALREALKVNDLETLLAGVGGQFDKIFRSFEQTAADRVRIAKTYGLDLVKTEELNDKERQKVFDEALTSRIGDLKNLLDSIKFGDLFEGTAADQRQAILQQIATTRTQADQGVDGAASTLAGLERQLIDLSRTAFGTAGPEFAADRQQAQADAQRIIDEETARAHDAQEQAIAALNAATTQNDLTNETNNLLAHTNQLLGLIAGQGGARGAGGTINLSSLLDRQTFIGVAN